MNAKSETNGFDRNPMELTNTLKNPFLFWKKIKRDSQGALPVSDMDINPFARSELQPILS